MDFSPLSLDIASGSEAAGSGFNWLNEEVNIVQTKTEEIIAAQKEAFNLAERNLFELQKKLCEAERDVEALGDFLNSNQDPVCTVEEATGDNNVHWKCVRCLGLNDISVYNCIHCHLVRLKLEHIEQNYCACHSCIHLV